MPESELQVTPELLEQYPLLAFGIVLLASVFLTLLIGCIATWTVLAIRRFQGKAILPVADWTPRVWGLADILLVAFLVVLAQVSAYFFGRGFLGIQPVEGEQISLALAAVSGIGNLAAVVLGTIWLAVRFRVMPSHVGFTTNILKVGLIGVIAGFAFIPIIYAGNVIVSLGMDVKYKHPLIEAVTSDGTPVNFLLAVFAAAVVAPVAEEFLFRGLIQGWLQSIPFRPFAESLLGKLPDSWREPYPVAATAVIEPSMNHSGHSNPFQVATSIGHPGSGVTDPYTTPAVPPIWPAVVAGVLFGLAHWGYGLSFIPLSLFGFALGMVYRATHSIWPCILIHFMMNGTSMIALGVTAYLKNVAPVPEELGMIMSWLFCVTQGQ